LEIHELILKALSEDIEHETIVVTFFVSSVILSMFLGGEKKGLVFAQKKA
jgi:hypothetical protein